MEPEELDEQPEELEGQPEKDGLLPESTGVKTDPRNRLQEYLQMQLQRSQRMQSPEYQQSVGQTNLGQANRAADNSLGALFMNSAAQFGNVAGKTPDASGYGQFVNDLNKQGQQFSAGLQNEDMARDQAQNKKAKLYEYLSQMQHQQSQEDVAAKNAETKRLALQNPDYQGGPVINPQTGEVQMFDKRSGRLVSVGKTGVKPEKEMAEKMAPKVPASEAVNLGGYNSIDKTLDDLDSSFTGLTEGKRDIGKALSYAGSMFPGNTADATKFNQEARRAAQSIGTVLEKGKLTDADFEAKYLPMMPRWGDSPEIVKSKIQGLKQFARNKQKADLEALTQAGYQTENFSHLPALAPSNVVSGGGKSGTAQAGAGMKPLHQMTREEKLRELEELTGTR